METNKMMPKDYFETMAHGYIQQIRKGELSFHEAFMKAMEWAYHSGWADCDGSN